MLDLQRTRKIGFCRQLGDRFPRNSCTRDAEFEASVYPDVHACTHVITHVAHCAIRAWTHFLINTYVIKFGTVITGITCVLVPPFCKYECGTLFFCFFFLFFFTLEHRLLVHMSTYVHVYVYPYVSICVCACTEMYMYMFIMSLD